MGSSLELGNTDLAFVMVIPRYKALHWSIELFEVKHKVVEEGKPGRGSSKVWCSASHVPGLPVE